MLAPRTGRENKMTLRAISTPTKRSIRVAGALAIFAMFPMVHGSENEAPCLTGGIARFSNLTGHLDCARKTLAKRHGLDSGPPCRTAIGARRSQSKKQPSDPTPSSPHSTIEPIEIPFPFLAGILPPNPTHHAQPR